MSHLMVCKLNLRDPAKVKQALEILGFTEIRFDIDGKLKSVNYDRTENANCYIVMDKNIFSGFGDFAVRKAADGELEILVDDLDIREKYGSLASKAEANPNYSTAVSFMDNISIWYSACVANDAMVTQGLTPEVAWNDERTELNLYAEYN